MDPNIQAQIQSILAEVPFSQRVRIWQQVLTEAGPGGQVSVDMVNSMVTSYKREQEVNQPQPPVELGSSRPQ